MKAPLKKYAGILLGALYALILRLVFNIQGLEHAYNLFSITFIWVAPVIIGLIPLFYANKNQLESWSYRIFSPVLTVLLFSLICLLTRIEDLICLWVLMLPYFFGAGLVGLIAGEIIKKRKVKKGTLYSLIILPLFLSPIEQQIEPVSERYTVETKVLIQAPPDRIWENIIRVKEIEAGEYEKGFFNYAGIPRPLYAELDKDTLGATRIGHFEGGLKFEEKVTTWERNEHIAFDITVVPASIRKTVFDQHILKGQHFKFLNASYRLQPLADGQTRLILTSSYALNTHINGYSSYCGNQLLSDFQERLLEVIKDRCESTTP